MARDEESDDARIITEAMSEVFNGLCRLAEPDRFGHPSLDDVTSLRACLRELIDRAPNFRGWTSPELDLKSVAGVSRELELEFDSGENLPGANARFMELARRFALEMGSAAFPPVENVPEFDLSTALHNALEAMRDEKPAGLPHEDEDRWASNKMAVGLYNVALFSAALCSEPASVRTQHVTGFRTLVAHVQEVVGEKPNMQITIGPGTERSCAEMSGLLSQLSSALAADAPTPAVIEAARQFASSLGVNVPMRYRIR